MTSTVTRPLGHIHRDALTRVIRRGDMLLWTNRKQGNGMIFAVAESSTPESVRIRRLDTDRLTNVKPENLLVITAQVETNLNDNVGANMDLEATR